MLIKAETQDHEFASDVIAILKRRRVTFRGMQPSHITIFLDGSLKVWFADHAKAGNETQKGIWIHDIDPIKQAIHFGKPEIIAELCEKLIDYHSARWH